MKFISEAIKKFYKNSEVETATEGFIAGKKISEFKPDLLILNIRLLGINGFEVIQHLKKDKTLSNMKIIVITAFTSEETERKILNFGADDYLSKPFTIEELNKKLKKSLKGVL